MENKQKDRHLETPSEANRDKHINFLAEENGDIDPADEDLEQETSTEDGEDNGFFTNDDNSLDSEEKDKERTDKEKKGEEQEKQGGIY